VVARGFGGSRARAKGWGTGTETKAQLSRKTCQVVFTVTDTGRLSATTTFEVVVGARANVCGHDPGRRVGLRRDPCSVAAVSEHRTAHAGRCSKTREVADFPGADSARPLKFSDNRPFWPSCGL
jgi:hypothetical protein